MPSSAAAAAAASAAAAAAAAALSGDPVAYFKKMLAQGPIPEAANWTCLDIVTALRETVLQSSIQRTLQQANLLDGTRPSVQEMWHR
jgi:hypothetical protein